MPKDNEVDEKVMPESAAQQVAAYRWRPIGWGVIGDWRVGPPEIVHIVIGDDRYEVEELVPAATVAELRAKAAAAERRVGELTSLLSDTVGNLRRMANDEFADCDQVRLEHVVNRIEHTLTGADPT